MKKIFLVLLFFAVVCSSNAQQLLQFSTATSGTITVIDTQQDVVVVQEGVLALALTLAMPANPVDAQRVTFVSTGGVTALSLTAVIGNVVGALTAISSNAPASYVYSKTKDKWYRCR